MSMGGLHKTLKPVCVCCMSGVILKTVHRAQRR